MKKLLHPLLQLLVALAVLIAVWQGIAASGWVPDEYFPGVPRIGHAFMGLWDSGELLTAEGLTMARALTGLVISCVLGFALALLGTQVPLVRHALAPLVSVFQVLPPAALVPMAVFALGFGPGFFLFIICFASIWPVYLSALRSLGSTEPLQIASGLSLGYAPHELLWRVRLPAALPEIFTGIRISAGIALIATVAAEMLTSRNGIGFLLFDTAFSLRVDETFAVLAVAAFNGVLINTLVVGLRRLSIGWNEQLHAQD